MSWFTNQHNNVTQDTEQAGGCVALTVETLFHVEILRVRRVRELARVGFKQATRPAVDEGDTAGVDVTHPHTFNQRHL